MRIVGNLSSLARLSSSPSDLIRGPRVSRRRTGPETLIYLHKPQTTTLDPRVKREDDNCVCSHDLSATEMRRIHI